MNRVDRIISYLNENVNESLSIDDISTASHLSPVQLYRVFKRSTGFTPTQYHEQLKIKESLSLLQYSGRVDDVAFKLGYKNYETFSRAFKKICNFSPSDLLWAMTFINSQSDDYPYALVKEEASMPQIKQLFTEASKTIDETSNTLIYRLYPQTEGRPQILRCHHSEEFIKASFL